MPIDDLTALGQKMREARKNNTHMVDIVKGAVVVHCELSQHL